MQNRRLACAAIFLQILVSRRTKLTKPRFIFVALAHAAFASRSLDDSVNPMHIESSFLFVRTIPFSPRIYQDSVSYKTDN